MSRTITANGEKIKKLRADREWDQQELATKAAVSLATVQSIEREEPTFRKTLGKIATAFKLAEGYQKLLSDNCEWKTWDVQINISISVDQFKQSGDLEVLMGLLERLVSADRLTMNPRITSGSTIVTLTLPAYRIRKLVQICQDFKENVRQIYEDEMDEYLNDILPLIELITDIVLPNDYVDEFARGSILR